MNTLQEECGHTNLRLGFAPYITLIGEGEKRLTDLAEILGVSRQACNQTAKQVEAAGYIERRAHPTDRRRTPALHCLLRAYDCDGTVFVSLPDSTDSLPRLPGRRTLERQVDLSANSIDNWVSG